MSQSELHAFAGFRPRREPSTVDRSMPREGVTVRLGEIASLLADAVRSDRTWLYDFQDDEVTLSSDLYDVLTAYRRLRRATV